MKKLLILTSHFVPDRSAGSFRMAALVSEFSKYPDLLECHVYSMYPNRNFGSEQNCVLEEENGNVIITRIPLLFTESSGIKLIANYLYYFFQVLLKTRSHNYDVVFATSSKFFTSFLGFLITSRKGKFIIEYRDLFWDNVKYIYGKKILCEIGNLIEKRILARADKISIVSKGFEDYFCKKVSPAKEIGYFPNGIDSLFLTERIRTRTCKNRFPESAIVKILYAGNIGVGQGLEKIVPSFAKKFASRCSITIIGDGSKKEKLRLNLEHCGTKNVTLLPSMDREKILSCYAQADVLLVTLNDVKAFEKVLPSKIFEYGATELPILAGVSGHASHFLKSEVDGAFVFPANDLLEMGRQFELLLSNSRRYDRTSFVAKYQRDSIICDLAKFILSELKVTSSI